MSASYLIYALGKVNDIEPQSNCLNVDKIINTYTAYSTSTVRTVNVFLVVLERNTGLLGPP